MTGSTPQSKEPKAVQESRDIGLLRPFPQQEFFFRDEAGADVGELAADILANGLREMIETAPDGTILSGHRRRAALLRLVAQGHKQFQAWKVWVRYDLAAKGPAALKRRFLEANRNRRHLTPMAYAAISRAIYESEIGTSHSDADLKERIARQYNVNVKTLERWWALLDLPIELLCFIERKELTQQLGQHLLDYAEPTEMQELVELARSSPAEDVERRARELLKGRIPPKPRKEMAPDQVLQEFLEVSLDMTIQHDAIAEIVRRDLGERKQMLFYFRRLKQAELVVPLLLAIVKKSKRLEADDLAYRPTLGRKSVAGLLQALGAASTGAADPNTETEPKKAPPPLKLKPAKQLPPLKLPKQPTA